MSTEGPADRDANDVRMQSNTLPGQFHRRDLQCFAPSDTESGHGSGTRAMGEYSGLHMFTPSARSTTLQFAPQIRQVESTRRGSKTKSP